MVMSTCSLLLCCWKRVFAMISAFSWQNSVSLCPASFGPPRPNLSVIPGMSDFLLLHSSPLEWNGHLFWVLILEALVVFIELLNFSFFSIIGWSIDLDYCDIECFALETNREHSVVYEIASKYCISDSCLLWGLLKGSFRAQNSLELKLPSRSSPPFYAK